jgi:hypothetical protein
MSFESSFRGGSSYAVPSYFIILAMAKGCQAEVVYEDTCSPCVSSRSVAPGPSLGIVRRIPEYSQTLRIGIERADTRFLFISAADRSTQRLHGIGSGALFAR